MKKNNAKIVSIILSLSLIVTYMVFAGDLTPTATPDNSGSAMFTLEDLYQRLLNGLAGAKRSGGFAEPSAGPTSGTMHNINDIMGKMPVKDDSNGAIDTNVLQGKKFWGLTSGQWGPKEGIMPNIGQQNVTPGTSNVTINMGYHNGTGAVAGDADLVSGNIRAGVNLFGISGNSNVVNTSSGDAATATIRFGKVAWVDGHEIVGHLAGGSACEPGATYSPLKRWCNNGNGTITDTTTGLIWLQRGNSFWGTYASCSANISYLRSGTEGLTDGSASYDWRLPTVKELLNLTSGTEAISPGSQYLFTGMQTGWYWTCSASTNPIPLKKMRVQMPYTNPYGVAENPSALFWGLAVRNP